MIENIKRLALLLIFLPATCQAQTVVSTLNQSHIDSLKNQLYKTVEKENQIDLHFEIASAYNVLNQEKDSIQFHLNQSINILKGWSNNQEKNNKHIGILYLMKSSGLTRSVDSLQSTILQMISMEELKVKLFLMEHDSKMPFENIETCMASIDSAKFHLNQIPEEKWLFDYYFELGLCYYENNQLLNALQYLIKAEEWITEKDDKIYGLLSNIASIYDELEAFGKTYEYGVKSKNIAIKNNHVYSELFSYTIICSAAFAVQQHERLKNNALKAISLNKSIYGNDLGAGYLYFLLGRTAIAENDLALAEKYLIRALEISNTNNNELEKSEAHSALSTLMFRKNEMTQARYHANQALKMDIDYDLKRSLNFSEVFSKQADYKNAYEVLYQQVTQKVKRDSANNPYTIVSSLINDKFENDKERLEEEVKYQKQIGFKNFLIALGIAIISLLIFLFFFIRKRNKTHNQLLTKQVKEQTQKIQNQKERLEELDQAKSKLYTNITHEFRTPLTVISGLINQLKNHDEIKKPIQRNSDQLLNLVNQILDLKKLESGDMPLHFIQADIIRYIRYLMESFLSYGESVGITFHFLTEKENLIMDFDKEKITRIISNLLSNAIKFTPEGGNIYVRTEIQDHIFSLEIKDTGQGILAKELPFIFNRFYQVDDTSTRKGEGTGIGLTLVKELLTAMKGDINVSSIKGKGATFMLTLPITNDAPIDHDERKVQDVFFHKKITEKEKTEMINTTNSPTLDDTQKPTILLIEDNADVIHYLIKCLQENYQLDIAMNGEEGINKAIEEIPDFIISDVMMPIKDGFEVTQTLKNDERTSHIPIILLTAKANIEARLEGLQRGADVYLSKPFHQEELLLHIQNLLGLRKKIHARYANFLPPNSGDSTVELASEEEEKHLEIEDVFLQKIRAVIEKDLSDSEMSMPQLVRAIGMSRSQIYKKVKALTGQSPSQYIRSIRLAHAQELLKNSDLNISEIGYQVGFSSLEYFSQVFFDEFGIRPSETRK